jgi:serine/threonine protein kinase
MSELIGRTLGQYRIVEKIGQGGMATVYKAYQPGLDRYVALKVLPPLHAREPGFGERFRREAKAIANLNHPNILPVHDFGQEGEYSFITMRYIEGARTLKEVMAGSLSLNQVTHLIGQVAAALDYAHRQGVIHRDVKPSNVLMDGDWALLTDFGLAKMTEASVKLTGTGVGIGTPAYMSPEQGQGLPVDHRTDIYSLGVVLFEMLTGRIPHDAETPFAIIVKRMSEPLPLPRSSTRRFRSRWSG